MSDHLTDDQADEIERHFPSCPECSAPWSLHWVYVWEGGEKKRRYNTCGMTREQIAAKWLDRTAT